MSYIWRSQLKKMCVEFNNINLTSEKTLVYIFLDGLSLHFIRYLNLEETPASSVYLITYLQLLYKKECKDWRSLSFLNHDNSTYMHLITTLTKTNLLFRCFSFGRLLFRVRARLSPRLVVLFIFLKILFTFSISLSSFLFIFRVWRCLVVKIDISTITNKHSYCTQNRF